MKNKLFIIILIFLFCFPIVFPLLQKGFFMTDDGEWMIIRFSAFHQSLREGQFPVRFLTRLNHGYGYPVANFLYPGFMYLAEPFKIIGFGFVDSVKIVIGIALICSVIFTFLWLRQFFPTFAALFGGFVSVYTPYHLYDVYKRGSVGEVLALAVVPFVLWQIERKSFFWSSIGIAMLVLSHNTLALFFLPIVAVYSLLQIYSKKTLRKNLVYFSRVFITGLALSGFFWIPAIFELSYTKFAQTQVSDYKNYFATIEMIGYATVALFSFAVYFIAKQREDSLIARRFVFFVCLMVLSLFFSLSLSTQIWHMLPASLIQFPFRLLSVVVVANSFLVAYMSKQNKVLGFFFCVFFFISAVPFMKPAVYFDKSDSYYATNEDTTTVKNEYMPKWVKNDPSEHPKQKMVISDNNEIVVHTVYYPGWTAKVNGVTVPISVTKEGFISFFTPSRASDIHLFFTETPLRILANFISLFSFIVLLIYTVKYQKLWQK